MLVDTYDIIDCGPRNRFIANGKLVSNSNWQNLKRGSELRKAIKAPPGYSLIIADLAQIEARVNAWFAGQHNVLAAFANGEDVYRIQASNIYNKPVSAILPEERFIGKTCVAEGTLVLCDSGWKAIETITTEDRVWDGESWRQHQGLLKNGLRETVQSCGVWLTPDHEIFTGETWARADALLRDASSRSLALEHAAANLPSVGMYSRFAVSALSSLLVTAGYRSTRSTYTTSAISKALAATCARSWLRALSGTGSTPKPCQMTHTGLVSSTGCLQPSRAAIAQAARFGKATAGAVSMSATSGATTARSFFVTCKRFLAGITQRLKWTVSTWTLATSPGISALSPLETMRSTNAASTTSKRWLRTYDLLSVEKTKRFVVCGKNGPLLVHNCALGLGYGAGWMKFASMLRIGALGPPVSITDSLARDIHRGWRQSNQYIVANWKSTENKFRSAALGKQSIEDGVVTYEGAGKHAFMHLPSGMAIRYDFFEQTENGMRYMRRYRVNKTKGPTISYGKLYGGLLVENRTQGLARQVVAEQALTIADELKYWKLAMTTHDELVGLVPTRYAARALKVVQKVMSTPPLWAPDLPLAVDAHISQRYDK